MAIRTQSQIAKGPNIVTDGLIMCLDAANTKSYVSGSNTWTDLSRGGNNGTLINLPTFSSENGGSIVFDGVDEYGTVTQLNTNTNFTFEVFLKCTNVFKDQMYMGTADTAVYVRILNEQPHMSIRTTPGLIQRTFSPPIILQNDRIYHIVSSYNGIQMKIYVNGVLYTGTILNENIIAWSINRIGMYRDASPRNFVGNIFLSKLYNRALSDSEVLQNYNATKTRFGL
jgi:hypothetical protein